MAGPPSRSRGRQGPPAVLAVDGGASKTDALLIDARGTLLGNARGAGTNHQMVGIDAAVANLLEVVEATCASAGLPASRSGEPLCPTAVYCLAGIDLPVDEQRLGSAVGGLGFAERVDLRNDTFAVLRAGTASGWGVGLVCGTGLNCVALGPDGASVRFPSLGELSGDFTPGGAWLGIRGLGLALRAGDGRGEATALRDVVAARFALESPEAVLEAVYGGDIGYDRLFELAEDVLTAADEHDGPAVEAVEALADEAAAMANAAIARLGIGAGPVEVVVGGGIFEHHGFAGRVLSAIQEVSPAAVLRSLEAPPVIGAALLGLDAVAAGPEAEAKLRAELSDWSPERL